MQAPVEKRNRSIRTFEECRIGPPKWVPKYESRMLTHIDEKDLERGSPEEEQEPKVRATCVLRSLIPEESSKKWQELPLVKPPKLMEQPTPRATKYRDQAVPLTNKQLENILQWWSMMERYKTISGLAVKLLDMQTSIEPAQLLKDTWDDKKGKMHQDHPSMLTKFIQWGDEHEVLDLWSEKAVYKYMLYANQKGRCPTFGTRFLTAFNFFTKRAEILENPQKITKVQYIQAQVAICTNTKKDPKREAKPLTMQMLEEIENRLFDKARSPYEREVWGFVLFLAHSRFRALDGSRIPTEPKVESGQRHGILSCKTRSELMKNGQTPGRKSYEVTVCAHAVFITGRHWAREWLDNRANIGMSAENLGFLQQNVNKDWRPVPDAEPMNSDKVTYLIRMICKNLGMNDAECMEYSSHSCKPCFVTVGSKRGINRELRRMLGYHASGRQECVELYSRENWSAPMRVLGCILHEIREGIFFPDKEYGHRFRKGYEPFKVKFDDPLPELAKKVPEPKTPEHGQEGEDESNKDEAGEQSEARSSAAESENGDDSEAQETEEGSRQEDSPPKGQGTMAEPTVRPMEYPPQELHLELRADEVEDRDDCSTDEERPQDPDDRQFIDKDDQWEVLAPAAGAVPLRLLQIGTQIIHMAFCVSPTQPVPLCQNPSRMHTRASTARYKPFPLPFAVNCMECAMLMQMEDDTSEKGE